MAAIELYSTPLYSDASLVSYKRFEGNSNDTKNASFNGTDSSISYNASYGKFNQGASFSNASNSKITCSDFTGMNMSSNWAFITWVNFSSVSGLIIAAKNSTGQLRIFPNNGGASTLIDAATWGSQGSIWTGSITVPTGIMGLYVVEHRTSDDKCHFVWQDTNGKLDSGWVSKTVAWGAGTQSGLTFNMLADGSAGNSPSMYMDDQAWLSRNLTDDEISNLYSGNWSTFVPKVIII